MKRLLRYLAGVRRGGALAVRLVLAIVLFALASTLVLTAVQLTFQYQDNVAAIKTRFDELQNLQVPVLTESVWVYDDAQIKMQLEAISQLPDIEIARVKVKDQTGWSVGRPVSKRQLTQTFPLLRDKGATHIGVLEVVVSMDKVYDRLIGNALVILLQNAVLTLVIAGFVLVIFQRWVTRHLAQMAEYARDLDIGNAGTPDLALDRPARRQPDILEQLVNSINTMRRNLGQAYQELAEYTNELAESKKKFAAIFHSSPVALSVSRFDGKYSIIDVNEAWVSQFGRERDTVIGRDNSEEDFWRDPADSAAILAAIEQGGEIRRYEAWRRRGDGSVLLAEISARVFDVGSETLLLLAEEDITEKRRIELEVRELNANLEKLVEERTARLQTANQDLKTALDNLNNAMEEIVRSERLAAVGSMVAGVAHELNTPIGNTLMVASTLNEQTKEISRAFAAGQMKRSTLETFIDQAGKGSDLIVRNLNRAAELLSSFKRVAVDQTCAHRRPFPLLEVIHEIVITMRPTLKKTPYQIEYDIPGEIQMDSYPGPLGQVISNLINNAVMHAFEGMDHGTVRITAKKANEETVEIRVRDDGRGIDPAHIRRIFDPFFTTKLGQGGSGLGLHVVQNIVSAQLGGTIKVESTLGHGATFILNIPNVAPKSQTVPTE